MCNPAWPHPSRSIHYDKGEHRRKHRGVKDYAVMVLQKGDHWVGKCPRQFCAITALMLLRDGIPEFRQTTCDGPYRLWSYHDGTIYVARSHDGGETWHGFPYGPPAPPPPRTILRQLRSRARLLGEEPKLSAWLNKTWNSIR